LAGGPESSSVNTLTARTVVVIAAAARAAHGRARRPRDSARIIGRADRPMSRPMVSAPRRTVLLVDVMVLLLVSSSPPTGGRSTGGASDVAVSPGAPAGYATGIGGSPGAPRGSARVARYSQRPHTELYHSLGVRLRPASARAASARRSGSRSHTATPRPSVTAIAPPSGRRKPGVRSALGDRAAMGSPIRVRVA